MGGHRRWGSPAILAAQERLIAVRMVANETECIAAARAATCRLFADSRTSLQAVLEAMG